MLLSIVVSAFWIFVNATNIYASPILGAIFEILWLPLVLMTFLLPVLALIGWSKQKFNIKSFYLYSILVLALAFLAITLIRMLF